MANKEEEAFLLRYPPLSTPNIETAEESLLNIGGCSAVQVMCRWNVCCKCY